MDPVNPWLDPSEVWHLAEQLLRPVASTCLFATDPGFDTSFVGFTTNDAFNLVCEEKETYMPLSVPKPVMPFSQPAAADSSQTCFLERVSTFRHWLTKNFKATDIFILDSEGKVICDESGHGQLHFMARNLAVASRGAGNIHIKVGPTAILEIIPCVTPRGRIVLGALVPDALPVSQIQSITEFLIQTATPA